MGYELDRPKQDRNALSLRCIPRDHCFWKMVAEKALLVVGLVGPSSLRFPIPSAWHVTRPQAGARETAAALTRVAAGAQGELGLPNQGLAVQCPNIYRAAALPMRSARTPCCHSQRLPECQASLQPPPGLQLLMTPNAVTESSCARRSAPALT